MSNLDGNMFPVGWAVSLRRGLDWIVETARDAGITQLQLSYLPELDTEDGIARIRDAARSLGGEIVAITFGFEGEDWSSIPSIYRTCGLAPAATRAPRIEGFRRTARFARRLGVRRLAGHLGHLPADTAEHRDLADVISTLCGELAAAGQTLSMETGQEPAQRMESFLRTVRAQNLTVNFDPANFILYHNGHPGEAWEILRPWVDAVHCKDATSGTDRAHLGNEARLDEGDVGFAAWLQQALDAGFDGPVVIETGVKGEQLPPDLLRARQRIQGIVAAHRADRAGTVCT